MAEYASDSIPQLVRTLLADTRDLIREEVALARAELRREALEIRGTATAFGAATLAGVIGIVMLAIAAGGLLAYAADWPAWAGYGVVAIVLVVAALLLAGYGRRRLRAIRVLPETRATLKENAEWLQSKSMPR